MVHHLITPAVTDTNCCFQKKNPSLVDHLVKEVCHIHHQLDEIKSLTPSDHVNTLFTKLVNVCTFQYDEDTVNHVLSDIRIKTILPHIRSLASQGEYYLELFWARNLVQQTNSNPNLAKFVYYQNYVDLVQLEIHALQGVGAKLDTIVFIGSGPLPLSSILMSQVLSKDGPVMIHNIDRDQESITVSTKLVDKLGIQGIQQHVMEASHFSGFSNADVVILGALVGSTLEEKMEFLVGIGNHMEKGSFIMLRSAHSLRKLLYPSIEPHHVNKCGFETAIVLHPFNDVVNSVLIAKKV